MSYFTESLIESEQQTKKLANQVAKKIVQFNQFNQSEQGNQKEQSNQAFKLYLAGQLGTGKTTFTRYLLKALGYKDLVKSPTYSLIESYKIKTKNNSLWHQSDDCFEVYHLDLYRISAVEELEFLDYKTCFENGFLVIIEWADDFLDQLLKPDMKIEWIYSKGAEVKINQSTTSRQVKIESEHFKINL